MHKSRLCMVAFFKVGEIGEQAAIMAMIVSSLSCLAPRVIVTLLENV